MEDIHNIRLVESSPGEFTFMGWVRNSPAKYSDKELQQRLMNDGKAFLEQLLGYKIIPMDQYSKELHEKYDRD